MTTRRGFFTFMAAAGAALAADLPLPPAGGAGDQRTPVYMTVAALERKPGKAPAHYHTWADCGLLHAEANHIRQMTEHDAQVHGYTLCPRCARRNSRPGLAAPFEAWTKPVSDEQLRQATREIEGASK